MFDYYEKVRQNALDAMRRLIGKEVEDSCADMERAHTYACRHGSYEDMTKATSILSDYKWAMHEIWAHKAMAAK